jgi:hypothetical protein
MTGLPFSVCVRAFLESLVLQLVKTTLNLVFWYLQPVGYFLRVQALLPVQAKDRLVVLVIHTPRSAE